MSVCIVQSKNVFCQQTTTQEVPKSDEGRAQLAKCSSVSCSADDKPPSNAMNRKLLVWPYSSLVCFKALGVFAGFGKDSAGVSDIFERGDE